MSFSSTIKNDLCKLEQKNKCCLHSELTAILRINAALKFTDNSVNAKLTTENAAFARHIFTSIRNLYNYNPQVIIRKSKKLKKHTSYMIIINSREVLEVVLCDAGLDIDEVNLNMNYKNYISNISKKMCCKKAFLRGAFLAAGSMSDPEKNYHLEITTHMLTLAQEVSEIMNMFDLNSKIIKRKESYVVYLKEGENIVDFLNIIGAHGALMELENIRILKEMRNNVNRIVNCETANLEKTVNASVRQIENIHLIKERKGLENLPHSLREIAELRLKYSDASLKELGDMMSPPLGKSGVNHRLRKLDEIADKLR